MSADRRDGPGDISEPSSAGPSGEEEQSNAYMGSNLVAYLLSGLLLGGGGGHLLDRWLGTDWVVMLGTVLGTGLGVYVIWVRYIGGGAVAPPAEPPVRRGRRR